MTIPTDVRYGLRLLRRSPIFASVAIATLALGTGVNTAVFSVVDTVLIRRLPYADPDSAVMVWEDASLAGISFGLWQRRFGADPSIVGTTIVMNDTRYEIVGVMQSHFVFRNRDVEYWIPMHFSPEQAAERGSHYLNVVARLRPGVSVEAASAEMQAIAKELERQFPGNNTRLGAVVVPIRDEVLGNQRLE